MSICFNLQIIPSYQHWTITLGMLQKRSCTLLSHNQAHKQKHGNPMTIDSLVSLHFKFQDDDLTIGFHLGDNVIGVLIHFFKNFAQTRWQQYWSTVIKIQ